MIYRLFIVLFAAAFVTVNAIATDIRSDMETVPEWAIIDPEEWSIIHDAMTDRTLKHLHFTNVRMLWQWKGVKGRFMHFIDTFGKPVKSDLFSLGEEKVLKKAIFNPQGYLIGLQFPLRNEFDPRNFKYFKNLKYIQITKIWDIQKRVDLTKYSFPENIESLSFFGANVIGLSALNELEDLKSLQFVEGNLDISELKPLPSVEILDLGSIDNLSSSDISELISLMPNLRHISLVLTNITSDDLTKIAKSHPNLVSLIVHPVRRKNHITKIDFLKELTNLKELYIYKEDLASFDELPTLPKLETLTINDTQLSDLTSVHRFPKLKYLNLGGNEIKDMTPLNHLTDLEEVIISGNPIETIQGLKNSKDLLRLNIARAPLISTKGLENNHKLEYLEVSSHKLTRLDNLTHLSNLKDLQVNTCNIYDTKGLPTPSSLEILRLDCGTGNYDFSGLKSQPNLREFYCSYCKKRPDISQSDKDLLEEIHERNVEFHDIRHEREKQERKALKAAYKSYKKNHFSKISQAAP